MNPVLPRHQRERHPPRRASGADGGRTPFTGPCAWWQQAWRSGRATHSRCRAPHRGGRGAHNYRWTSGDGGRGSQAAQGATAAETQSDVPGFRTAVMIHIRAKET
eukprot:scaffold56798_cov59-Phaeocystis_antarctica.AAC.5